MTPEDTTATVGPTAHRATRSRRFRSSQLGDAPRRVWLRAVVLAIGVSALIGVTATSALASAPNPCAAGSVPAASSITGPLTSSAPGALDSSFNLSGFNYSGEFSQFANGSAAGYGLTRQGDGKLIVAGCADSGISFALARYNTDGTLDTSFDVDGKVTTAFGGGTSIAEAGVEMDGTKIVAAGIAGDGSEFAVARYMPNGSPDTSFGGGSGRATVSFAGYSLLNANSMLIDGGKVVVAGYGVNNSTGVRDWLLVRLNSDGTPDASFGQNGQQATAWMTDATATSIIMQGSNYLVGGTADGGRFAVARYLASNGALDTSFDQDGKITTTIGSGFAEAWSIRLDTQGRIIEAGTADERTKLGLVAWKEFGTPGQWQPDPSFDVDGKVTTSFSDMSITSLQARGLGVQVSPSGVTQRLIVVGYGTGNESNGSAGLLASYSPCDGSLEAKGVSLFGANVKLRDVLIQSDAQIDVAGDAQAPLGADTGFLVARLNGNLASDSAGCAVGTTPTPTPTPTPTLSGQPRHPATPSPNATGGSGNNTSGSVVVVTSTSGGGVVLTVNNPTANSTVQATSSVPCTPGAITCCISTLPFACIGSVRANTYVVVGKVVKRHAKKGLVRLRIPFTNKRYRKLLMTALKRHHSHSFPARITVTITPPHGGHPIITSRQTKLRF